jgi:hypothetical protein
MNHRLAAGHVAAGQPELAHLHAQGAFDPHGRAHAEAVGDGPAQIDDHAVARVVVVAQDGDAAVVVGVDEVEIAVPARSPKAAPKLTPFWSRPQAALTSSNCRSPRLRKARWTPPAGGCVHDPDALGRGFRRASCARTNVDARDPGGKPLVTKRGRGGRRCPDPRSAATTSSRWRRCRRGRRLRGSGPCRCSAAARCGGTSARAESVRGSSALRPRASAMECWSARWVVAAMSATRKSMSPSLFTSPRSEPIEENDVCGRTRSSTLVNVPSRLLW